MKAMEKVNFSRHAKSEILSQLPKTESEQKAWLAAAVKACGSLKVDKSGFYIVFESDDADYLRAAAALIKSIYKTSLELMVSKGKNGVKKATLFTLKVPQGQSRSLLTDTGIFLTDGEGLPVIAEGMPYTANTGHACAVAFLQSLYAAAGSANVPTKIMGEDASIASSGSGYYLEFSVGDEAFARDLQELLQQQSITAGVTARKNKYVVYIKESEQISNLLAMLAAHDSVLYLQDILVERLVNNNLNRQSNCEVANLDKSAAASARQILAIEKIQSEKGLDILPPKLKDIARLRLENPTASLDFFAGELNISKSGVNHRFRKIIEIADGGIFTEEDNG